MNYILPHHLSAQTLDVLPCDIAVETCGGLIDLYADVNTPTWHRWRLTVDTAFELYYRLAQHLPTPQLERDHS
ncbi:hypothetical protein CG716_11060 [Mycolicibacterium sphagni]|uniref:Uncharacterized protein n=1 Tax=Mycolicibacterium sphagni TaxID=1786 RepID=A0A255DKJ9_9MYCO|nr:hypothetical protein CG716_11060 [Mycolicibacterium sphagni]